MGTSRDREARMHSLKLTAAETAPVRNRLKDYLDRTGLSPRDLGERINYSKQAVNAFLADRYEQVAGNATLICRAITTFIEAHPIEPPMHSFGELYDTANVRAMRQTFQQLLQRPVAYMIYAPPGSQKSFVLEHLVAELNRAELAKNGAGCRAYYLYARAKLRPAQLMRDVARTCGVSPVGDRMAVENNLAFEFQSRCVLLVVDEAQHLSLDGFEVLRVLLDRPPNFSLLFSGSHDLKATFDNFSATLEQWNSRIVDKVRLPGVQREEATGIVRREVGELLLSVGCEKAAKMVDTLLEQATSKDAFEKGRKYINVRTLTNALQQIKLQANGNGVALSSEG